MPREGYYGTTISDDILGVLLYIGYERGHRTLPETIRFLASEGCPPPDEAEVLEEVIDRIK